MKDESRKIFSLLVVYHRLVTTLLPIRNKLALLLPGVYPNNGSTKRAILIILKEPIWMGFDLRRSFRSAII
jgi:hypothetical protein